MDSLMRPAVITDPEEDGSDLRTPHRVPITDAAPPRSEEESQPRDLLTLGGLYYQRAELSGALAPEDTRTSLHPSVPSLVDLSLDIKPSESMSGFVKGRLLYDPLDKVLSSPSVQLDQFWFQFGIARRVFVSLGRQQIKWGSARVWNPTDFLRQPNPQPLDAFDLRTGVDMLKVGIPWEEMTSNLWFIATADLNGTGEDKLRYGGAVRAETAIGGSELAATAVFQQGRRPRYGLDWGIGLGPLELYAEAALVRDSDVKHWKRTAEGFAEDPLQGPSVLASGGITGTFRVADVFRSVLRLEGFYNPLGYDDRGMLTWLQSTGDYRPLYFGRYYGMAQVSLARRSQYEPTVMATALMNVEDRTALGRVDFSMYALRDVIVRCFVEMPFGERGGEFRFEPDPSVADLPASGLALFRAGFSVRIRL
ncbi:hypothetical protein DAT35_34160 [Vitiosangium sp. GDMCC 1.1324]|nr:hypothetical protein DAT35_34160 [Vitiosangium sp. GDMCC 1.1324]